MPARAYGVLPLVERLANALHDRRLLLILDNFEHVRAAAPLVLGLVQTAHRVTALVTSRSALRVRGVREFPVAQSLAARPHCRRWISLPRWWRRK
jgi:predicted ATPase